MLIRFAERVITLIRYLLSKAGLFEQDYIYRKSYLGITKFVIITVERSGSSLLGELLQSHPEIICHQELFHPKGIFFSRPIKRLTDFKFSIGRRDDQPIEFLKEVWKHQTSNSKAIGFKILQTQNEAMISYLINEPGVRILVLRRSDLIGSFVSYKLALSTNVWNARHRKQKPKLPDRITIDLDEFSSYLKRDDIFFEQVLGELKKAKKDYELLRYEDLPDHRLWAKRILTFLNVNPEVHLESDLIKLGEYNLQQFIQNYDAAIDLLASESRSSMYAPKT